MKQVEGDGDGCGLDWPVTGARSTSDGADAYVGGREQGTLLGVAGSGAH
jgi:hypothetical protein